MPPAMATATSSAPEAKASPFSSVVAMARTLLVGGTRDMSFREDLFVRSEVRPGLLPPVLFNVPPGVLGEKPPPLGLS